MKPSEFDWKKYDIGEWVEVVVETKVVSYYADKRVLETGKWLPKVSRLRNRVGQIVGIKAVQTGPFNMPCDYEKAYITKITVHHLWMIRLGKMNKPILALPENIALMQPCGRELPKFYRAGGQKK